MARNTPSGKSKPKAVVGKAVTASQAKSSFVEVLHLIQQSRQRAYFLNTAKPCEEHEIYLLMATRIQWPVHEIAS